MKRFFAYAVIALMCATVDAQGAHQSRSKLSGSEIYSRTSQSVVVIFATDQTGQQQVLGSGFIVATDRIATNHHVLAGMNRAAVVFADGAMESVSGVAADSPEEDLIILAVTTRKRSPLQLGDELSLRQGDIVYALGAPEGLALSLTNGIVSSFRNSDGKFRIQTTAPISHGSSGGPLFDETGLVVGITTSLLADAPGIYFSVGVGDLKRLLRTPNLAILPLDQWGGDKSSDSSEPARPNVSAEVSQTNQIEDYISQGKFDEARAAIRTLASKEPANPLVHRLTGELSLRLGDIEAASHELSIAAQQAPNDAVAHFDYAVVLSDERKFQEALTEEETSNRLVPTDEDRPFLAKLYYANEMYAQSESMAHATLESEPKNRLALDVLAGLAYHNQSGYVRVRDSDGKTYDIRLDKLSEFRRYNATAQVMSDMEVFTQYVHELSEIDPQDYWWQINRAAVAFTNHNDSEFVSLLIAAEKTGFPDATAFLNLVQFFEEHSQMESAEGQVKAGLTSLPEDPELLGIGMYISLVQGNTAVAARRFQDLQEHHSDAAVTLPSSCLYYYGTQEIGTALTYCARFAEQFPADPRAHSDYGWVALEANNFSLALQEFSKAYAMVSADSDKLTSTQAASFLWGLALAQFFSGDTNQARKLVASIKTKYLDVATMNGLQAKPLLFSPLALSRIRILMAKY
jgi:tetratricopeptide (TPR) repeat protein